MRTLILAIAAATMLAATGCSQRETLSAGKIDTPETAPSYEIGPGDSMQIFVWRNQDLTTSVSVRPDGRITVPLVEDLDASGKTPTELAKDIEGELAKYIQDPLVTVIMTGFVGTYDQQVRVVGEAANPRAIPYRDGMTLLDVMVNVGGLTQFAAGDRSTLVRVEDGEQKAYRVKLDSLVRDGEISANVAMLPGDILIIPETFL
jgi:polysaccharide export outer membrane protein